MISYNYLGMIYPVFTTVIRSLQAATATDLDLDIIQKKRLSQRWVDGKTCLINGY
jgi:hypothetical protein